MDLDGRPPRNARVCHRSKQWQMTYECHFPWKPYHAAIIELWLKKAGILDHMKLPYSSRELTAPPHILSLVFWPISLSACQHCAYAWRKYLYVCSKFEQECLNRYLLLQDRYLQIRHEHEQGKWWFVVVHWFIGFHKPWAMPDFSACWTCSRFIGFWNPLWKLNRF